jgi:uncharacterized protein (TIGR02145 family)
MKATILSLIILFSLNTMSQLVVSTDIPCEITINFTDEYNLIPHYKKRISLKNGEHFLSAKSIDGSLQWDTVIQIVDNEPEKLQIKLHSVVPVEASVLLIADTKCNVSVNDDEEIALEKDKGHKITLKKGVYELHAVSQEGKTWQKSISITNNSQKVVQIGFSDNADLPIKQDTQEPQTEKQGVTTKGTFTDSRDGKTYKTVKIGNQEWMAENLKYLPSVVGPGTGSNTTPYYYVYGYDGTDVNAVKVTFIYSTYGVLYNWSAAVNACPTGWHLPSDDEYTELTDYLVDNAGGKLKATGTIEASTGLWYDPNEGATNETGFTALPGGRRGLNGFVGIGSYGGWWSATECSTYNAWYRRMAYNLSNVYRGNLVKELGFSVRCVRD